MSKPLKRDREDTLQQLRKPTPIVNGPTWLRHDVNAQCGAIDLMVLKGTYSKEEMAKELINEKLHTGPLSAAKRRVTAHLSHLQDGKLDTRPNEPHKLKLTEDANGKWRFDMEGLL